MSISRAVLSILSALCIALALARPAAAHAALVGSDPAEAAVLPAAPAAVELRFNEAVTPIAVRLVGPDGGIVELTLPAAGKVLSVILPDGGAGSRVLAWRVVSEDGHPVAGTLGFSVGAPGPVRLPFGFEPGPDRAVSAALWGARFALHLGLAFGVGGVFALALLAPGSRAGRAKILGFLALGLLAVPLAYGLQGLDTLGLGLAFLGTPHPWHAAAGTAYARTDAVALVALVVALVALAAPRRPAMLLATLGILGVGAALAASGHAASAAPRWVTRGALAAHGVTLSFWLGSLIPLGTLLRNAAEEVTTTALRRFSVIAPWVVGAILAGGAAMAWVQLDRPVDLVDTAYGRVLGAKLGLVAAILGLALYNRMRLTRPILAGDAGAARGLRRTIAAEIVIAVSILGLVGLWRFTPPPRLLAAMATEPAYTHIHTEAMMAEITISPGRAGPVRVDVLPMKADFSQISAEEVAVSLTHPASGIGPIRGEAVPVPEGGYAVEGLNLPVSGRWTVRLDVRTSAFDTRRLDGEINLR